MRLLFICTSLHGGGAERIVALLSKSFGGEIIIAVFNKKAVQLPYGGHLLNLGFAPTKNPIKKILNFFRRVRKLAIVKKRVAADVNISFMQAPNMLNLLTKGKTRTVISIRNYDYKKYKDSHNLFLKTEHYLQRFFISRADLIVTVSEELREFMLQKYNLRAQQVIAIHNGCPVNEIRVKAQETIDENLHRIFRFPVLITAGKLEKQKGHFQLIKIFALVKKNHKTLKLVILGTGSLKKQLVEYAHSFGLRIFDIDNFDATSVELNDVFFLGFQDNPYKYFHNSALFVLSSVYEGFPNVLIEAMACGLPIVSTDCKTGPKEILTDSDSRIRFGILVPVIEEASHDIGTVSALETSWINEISSLLSDNAKMQELQKLSIKRVEDFDTSRLVKEWKTVIFNEGNTLDHRYDNRLHFK